MQAKFLEAEKAVAESQAALLALRESKESEAIEQNKILSETAALKEKEISALKTTYDSLEKNSAVLRTKLRLGFISF